jgi:hypothetical protein
MASSIRRVRIDLEVAYARISGLEAQVATLTKALEQALSQPAVVYQGDPSGHLGPGFNLLARQAMANAEDEVTPAVAPAVAPTVHWFRADGTDPSKPIVEAA